MAMWADYLVTQVHHEPPGHIARLRVHRDNATSVGTAEDWPRKGQLTQGARGVVYNHGGTLFLRTDPDRIAADNLGKLPEY
jgi:hypothetical protein